MPGRYCCVPACKNRGGHKFPADQATAYAWRVAVKRVDQSTKKLWQPTSADVVCKAHFVPGDYKETLLGERGRLKDGAVPSIFDFKKPVDIHSPRAKRSAARSEAAEETLNIPDFIEEVTLSTTTPDEVVVESYDNDTRPEECFKESGSQCSLLGKCSIDNFISRPKQLQYYTGFQNYSHFMFFFNLLGPATFHLDSQCTAISPQDQLLLTLMKLRQAKDDIDLSFMFEISESTVSKIIVTWINFLYFQLKEIDIWASRDVVSKHMPEDFGKKYPQTRVILDATEVPIQKPSEVNAQSCTWSSYKHKNTLKTMIGCTPRGAVSYVSESFGGSASDRQIIENSELLRSENRLFSPGDSIMADRGIMVQDLFACQDVFVNTPTMLKGKSQLEAHEVIKDRRIASKRIHIERVIGLAKKYKILDTPLASSKLIFGSRIIFICFALCNFRQSIVGPYA
ncbi:uncharacterized protein [Argopecten irradians]|uniref:uncharacterized protein n=1 Tax=Argopecten irradians TaxID=31199 RepID=UPI003710AB14